jgi:hypothetical protein
MAMVGLGKRQSRWMPSLPPSVAIMRAPPDAISLRSRPAEKKRPLPVTTTARTPASSSQAAISSCSA